MLIYTYFQKCSLFSDRIRLGRLSTDERLPEIAAAARELEGAHPDGLVALGRKAEAYIYALIAGGSAEWVVRLSFSLARNARNPASIASLTRRAIRSCSVSGTEPVHIPTAQVA